MIRELRKNGWEISIVTTIPSKHPWLFEFVKETPDIFLLDHFLEIRDIPNFLEYFINSRDFDGVVISHSHVAYIFTAWLRLRFPKLPIVDYLHAVELVWLDGGYARLSSRETKHIDLHITSNNQVREWMIENGARANAIEICPTYIDTKKFSKSSRQRITTRKRLNIPRNVPVIIFAARFHEQKRPMLVLKIARRVAEKTSKFRLLCVGDGALEEKMKKFVRKNRLGKIIKFLGPQSNQQVAELMCASDILLLPSSYEGLDLVIYEAMAAGVAVLASDVGGNRELVKPQFGKLLSLGDDIWDEEAYSQILVEWIKDLPSILNMRTDARKHVRANYDLRKLGPHFDMLLKKMISANKSRRPTRASKTAITKTAKTGVKNSKLYWDYIWRLNRATPKKQNLGDRVYFILERCRRGVVYWWYKGAKTTIGEM